MPAQVNDRKYFINRIEFATQYIDSTKDLVNNRWKGENMCCQTRSKMREEKNHKNLWNIEIEGTKYKQNRHHIYYITYK